MKDKEDGGLELVLGLGLCQRDEKIGESENESVT